MFGKCKPESTKNAFFFRERLHFPSKRAYYLCRSVAIRSGISSVNPGLARAVARRPAETHRSRRHGNHGGKRTGVNDNSAVYDPTGLLAALHEAQRQAHENGVDNLTEEEIEAEIKAARAERKKRLGRNG